VSREGKDELAHGMTRALDDTRLRGELVQSALDAAVRNHDASQVRIRFQECLKQAAQAT
jgi:hypothetical protein